MATGSPADRFDDLVREGSSVQVEGWDFGWFDGRASEERPSWGYAASVGSRMSAVAGALDIQTGGGEVLATIPTAPPDVVATESWRPNVALARRNLRRLGADVVEVADDADLPFADGRFDLVVSRHPTVVLWSEIARVLRTGGSYFSQQVGAGSVHELTEAMMGPTEVSQFRSPQRAVRSAEAAGLEVVDLREARLRMEFRDIAAVIVFLRKVIWTVPGFTVEAYLEPLERLHQRIVASGPFVAHSTRFLIDARRR